MTKQVAISDLEEGQFCFYEGCLCGVYAHNGTCYQAVNLNENGKRNLTLGPDIIVEVATEAQIKSHVEENKPFLARMMDSLGGRRTPSGSVLAKAFRTVNAAKE